LQTITQKCPQNTGQKFLLKKAFLYMNQKRSCTSHKGNKKKCYDTLEEAREVILEMYDDPRFISSNLQAYNCRECGNVHIGNRKNYKKRL
jgi:hypothetical protein